MEYIVGCNYWASNAGTEMWQNWDEKAIREDMEILSKHKIEYLRVFPMWRDFQPIVPVRSTGSTTKVWEYRLTGDRKATNPYFLDPVMIERFSKFCDICEEYGMKLVVGIVTGWMSGRMFFPPALYMANVFSDITALMFQQKFVAGIVENFKHRKCIYAYDLGNECNAMSELEDPRAPLNWSLMISNAIRAHDNTRPVISGMHGLKVHHNAGYWTIQDQGEACDMLTTHPYPYFCEHADLTKMSSFRTGVHATFQTRLYADLSGKPCLVEELGNLGPMMCNDEIAADFMRLQLLSNWAHKSPGVMWWCANEQTNLTTHPYTANMCEIELGMIYADRTPKPVLKETKKIAEVIEGFDFKLPEPKKDAVCILTYRQDHLGASYMTYALAKQAGLNIEFSFANMEIPKSDIYMVPSIVAHQVMDRENYLELMRRVHDEGATLYISNDTGFLAEFKKYFGLEVTDGDKYTKRGTFEFEGETLDYTSTKNVYLKNLTADVLAKNNDGDIVIAENKYGKGRVIYVSVPLETMILGDRNAFDNKNYYKVYKSLFADKINSHEVATDNKNIGITLHPINENELYCVAINYINCEQELGLEIKDGYEVSEIYYGNLDKINGFDGTVFKIVKK